MFLVLISKASTIFKITISRTLDFTLVGFRKKRLTHICVSLYFLAVGMTRFELATTGPPDQYSKPG